MARADAQKKKIKCRKPSKENGCTARFQEYRFFLPFRQSNEQNRRKKYVYKKINSNTKAKKKKAKRKIPNVLNKLIPLLLS